VVKTGVPVLAAALFPLTTAAVGKEHDYIDAAPAVASALVYKLVLSPAQLKHPPNPVLTEVEEP